MPAKESPVPSWLKWGNDFDKDVLEFLDEMCSQDAVSKVHAEAAAIYLLGSRAVDPGQSYIEYAHRRALELYRHWYSRLQNKPLMPTHEAILEPDNGLAYLATLVEWANNARKTSSGGELACPRVVPKKDDVHIIRTLQTTGQCMTQEQIERGLPSTYSLSLKTIRKRLKILQAGGLVDQPNGDRGGWAITSAGTAAVASAAD